MSRPAILDPELPWIDLHRHLEGSARLATVVELGERHGIALPGAGLDGLRAAGVVTGREPDVMSFLARFRWILEVLADLDACRRLAHDAVEDAHREGLDYLELRFSPWYMAERHGLEPAAVVEAVLDGIEAASRDTGMPVGVIGTLSRTYGVEAVGQELAALLRCRDRLVAIDLAGDEIRFPAALFADAFRRVRDAGLGVTVHAGESLGAESVWSAIRDLGATRIGHAVRAGEDPALLDFMEEHGIGIEANLTSNVQTCSVGGYAAHPLAAQLARGIRATINSDDPTISGIDLRHEVEIAAPRAGLSQAAIRRAQADALEIAFLSPDQRRRLRSGAQEGGPVSESSEQAGRDDPTKPQGTGSPAAEPLKRRTLARLRARVRQLPPISPRLAIAIAIVGWLLIVLGVVQLLLPGPGVLTMFAGAALLSLVSRKIHDFLRRIFRPWPKGWRKLLQMRSRLRFWLHRKFPRTEDSSEP